MSINACIPALNDEDKTCTVFNHFGSAPAFVIAETDTNTVATIGTAHARGECNPLKALDNQKIEAVVVGGIGAGALSRLRERGIKVSRTG